MMLTSCRREDVPADAATDEGIKKTYDRGPVTLTLAVDRKEATIADRLTLTLEVAASEQFDFELPRFGDKLEQFGILDYHTTQPELLKDNRYRVTRTYVLEPFLSGEYTIPPMKVAFWKKDEQEPEKHEVETDELTINVKSLLPDTVADLDIHDAAGPVELPREPGKWLWALLLVVPAAASLPAWWLWRRRRNSAAAPGETRIPAHELAFRELRKLVAEKLPEKGEIKLFYQRISGVLRRYIENRFGLHAPEQTTEEFLEDLRSSEELNRRYRSLLEAFLEQCDLVKFADHRPGTPDVQRSFDSCKAFIVGTQEKEEQPT